MICPTLINTFRWLNPFISAFKKKNDYKGLYRIIYPDGLPHTLMKYKAGGLGTPIIANGKIAGHASLVEANPVLGAAACYQLMAAATQQYYLAAIDNKLSIIARNTNQILDFLYGEKASDLASEISFVQYVSENFTELALNPETRVSTLTSLQESYKTAVKNIDFYLREIESRAASFKPKSQDDGGRQIFKFLEICSTLEMSRQLLVLCRVLETAMIGSFSKAYEKYILDEIVVLSNRCNNQLNNSFGSLKSRVQTLTSTQSMNGLLGFMQPGTSKILKDAMSSLMELESRYKSDYDSFDRQCLTGFLDQFHKESKIIMDSNGRCYLENPLH